MAEWLKHRTSNSEVTAKWTDF
ncbi:hypothetical protein ACOMHN_042067 [Nucella lapillus]